LPPTDAAAPAGTAADPTLNSRLAAIIESSDDAIISKSLQGVIRTWNKGAERLFGWKSEEVVGKAINIIIPPDRQHEEPQILARLGRGERVDHFETIRMTKEGRLIDLSIVKHLIELHGGMVRAKSAGEGQGATFCIELPVMVVRSPAGDAPGDQPTGTDGSGRGSAAHERPSLTGVTVLVVDDEPDARGLVRRVLEDCGARVVLAASAAEALERVAAGPPEVVLSDIGMPGQDGYDFMRKLRSLPADAGGHTPAAALTAFARSEDRMRALRAGYQTHIAKPVDPAELVAVVASLAMRR
jgi:PAS domain S-box-containing protein